MSWTIFNLFVSFLVNFKYVTDGYNVDVTNAVVLGESLNSYFGYSVTVINNRDVEKCILIGAPSDNDPQMPHVTKPGTVYKCSFPTSRNSSTCARLSIDHKTASEVVDIDGTDYTVTHGKNNQWLSASLIAPTADSGRGIVTCAPKWYNADTYMNGICYEIPYNFKGENIKKILALSQPSEQLTNITGVPKYDYGMAGMGMSVHYTKQDADLFLGAPGLKDWTGGFVHIRGSTVNVMKSGIGKTAYGYAGYAITSGEYFSSTITFVAIGIPRADLVGKVIFFSTDRSEYNLLNADFELNGTDESKTELPMNSYFGGSLCSVDVNNDGKDDLLAGAPLYSNGIDDSVDQGKVFLYLGSRDVNIGFQKKIQTLSGGKVAYSRFGTTIASLGDINQDGYNDVAVGAPYENNLQGAVYIYNGYRLGLWPHHTQKISASELNRNLMGFGIAISSLKDLNEDKINDLVVGSYLADKAVIFYTRPVISMTAALEVVVNKDSVINVIDKDQRDVAVKICFTYDYNTCSYVVLHFTIAIDTQKGDLPRMVFQNGSRELEMRDIKVFTSIKKCSGLQNITVKSTNDLVSPIVLQAKYESVKMSCSESENATLSRFNAADPESPSNIVTKELQFKKDCADRICYTNLHLAATLNSTRIDQYFIIGTSDLTVNVEITKSGDPSYGSIFQIVCPWYLTYRKVEKIDGETDISCNIQLTDSDLENETFLQQPPFMTYFDTESSIFCSFGNPMYNTSGVTFQLLMQVPAVVTIDTFEIKLQASTLSNDTDWNDNNKTLVVHMMNSVEGTFTGVSLPDSIFIEKTTSTYAMEHLYELINRGPSSLPSSTLVVHYPHIEEDQRTLLYMNNTEIRCGAKCEAVCSIISFSRLYPIYMVVNGRHSIFQSISTDTLTLNNNHNIDCTTESCSRLSCDIRNLLPGTSVIVRLHMIAQNELLHSVQGKKSIQIVSNAIFNMDNSSLLASQYTFKEKLSTTLIPALIPQKVVPIWIYIVSAIGGIVVIVLVIFVLYKIGFFKRATRNEMRQKMEEIQKTKETEIVEYIANDCGEIAVEPMTVKMISFK